MNNSSDSETGDDTMFQLYQIVNELQSDARIQQQISTTSPSTTSLSTTSLSTTSISTTSDSTTSSENFNNRVLRNHFNYPPNTNFESSTTESTSSFETYSSIVLQQNRVNRAENTTSESTTSLESYSSSVSQDNGINRSENTRLELYRFQNPNCYICNGYYGPCFEDPTCATCHAFLYPNAAPDVQVTTMFREYSDDSDSGNDEPADLTYRHNGSADHVDNHIDGIPAAPIQLEDLAQQINRLSVTRHEVEVNIETLPPEVLMDVFKYLDEISLWSVGQVCVRWREILNMHVRPERWKNFTLLRWPLLAPLHDDQDWYAVYTSLIQSCWCIKCVRQMAAQECSAVEENSWRKHRLRTELRAMRLDPLEGIQAKPLDPLCCHWQATIQGPIGSPYEGGIFFLYIQIPYTYPMCPPVVRFLTRIFHPNISRHGDIGIDSIHHNWSLALTISKVLISIQSLLTDPFCDVCMEPEVGALYLRNKNEFEEQARMWTWRYAMHDLRQH